MTEQPFTTNPDPGPIGALRKCPCCACGSTPNQHVNIVLTRHLQTWKYPQGQNIPTGERHGAPAILCDQCIESKAEIKNLVELKDGEVILHPVGGPPMGNPAWIMENGEWAYHPELDETRESYICECGAEIDEEEWEMFNVLCETCHGEMLPFG